MAQNLRVPGPTPLPPSVLAAMSQPMINHRGPEYAALQERVVAALKRCLQTEADLLILTCSGSGGLEAAIVNTLSAGDKVLGISIGAFGDRFIAIAERYGVDVTPLSLPRGEAASPATIEQRLRENKGIKAVLLTHNETSTGVCNDLPAIARVVRHHGALLLVDAISSAGAVPLETDEWGCDVVITCSQKAFMSPPGLAMVSMNQRAWHAYERASLPHSYFDLGAAKLTQSKGQNPFTPAVTTLYALDAALRLIENEGLENVHARHKQVGECMRQRAAALGLPLLATDPDTASNTVTALRPPAGTDIASLLRRLRERHNVVLAGGQGALAGKIFRVGHVGWVNQADVDAVADALEEELTGAK